MENEKTPLSLWLTVILGGLLALGGICVKLQGVVDSFSGETIADLLAKSTSNDKVYDQNYDKEVDQYTLFNNGEYNKIVKYEDKGIITYLFKMETDTDIGNGGDKFDYELGRITINPQDLKKCKCSYNYKPRYTVDYHDDELKPIQTKWSDCSESEFIKNIHKIAPKKAEAFSALKEVLDIENKLMPCEYAEEGENPTCDKLMKEINEDELRKQHIELLQKLRNITLEEK